MCKNFSILFATSHPPKCHFFSCSSLSPCFLLLPSQSLAPINLAVLSQTIVTFRVTTLYYTKGILPRWWWWWWGGGRGGSTLSRGCLPKCHFFSCSSLSPCFLLLPSQSLAPINLAVLSQKIVTFRVATLYYTKGILPRWWWWGGGGGGGRGGSTLSRGCLPTMKVPEWPRRPTYITRGTDVNALSTPDL